MNQSKQTITAQKLLTYAHQLIADADGVLPEDYHALTTVIVWIALDIQLGGLELR